MAIGLAAARRTIVRRAALATIVEPSTPIRSPFTKPRSALRETEPSRKPFRGPRAAGASVSSTARNDRQPCRGSPGAGTRAKRQRIRTTPTDAALAVDTLDSRPCACGNSGRAAMTAHPSSAHSTACTDPRQKRRIFQQCLQPVVEGVSRRTRHLSPGRNEVVLNPGVAAHRHVQTPSQLSMVR